MESYSFKPKPGDAERLRLRVGETRVWWVEFDQPVERIFCSTAELSTVVEADSGVAWMGLETRHYPRRMPTDREGVWCCEYAIPIDRMAVDHEWMPLWMRIVRENGLHGSYRESGTEREYEF